MIETSQSFYDNSVFKYRNTTYSVHVDVFDNSAKTDVDDITVNANRFFYESQMYDGKAYDKSYATGELGGFFLNGKTILMPDTITTEQIGWWTPIGDVNGEFTTNPQITIEFNGNHDSAGITCQYDFYSYPLKSKCYWFNGALLLDSMELDGNGQLQVFDNPVSGYDKVVIEIIKVKPYCYSKLATVDYGVAIEFTPEQLQGSNLTEKVSLMSNTVSPNELEFNIINYDYKYNVFNTDSLFKYFKYGQSVSVEAGVMNRETETYENISMGKFFISSTSVESGILKVKCYGILNMLNEETFYSPFYTNETVSNIVGDILSGYSYFVHDNVANITLTGYIPTKSKKEALKDVALACNAVIKENRDGSIWFYKATEEFSSNQLITETTLYNAFGLAGELRAGETPIYSVKPVSNVFTVTRDQRISQIKTSLIGTYSRCDVTYLTYSLDASNTQSYDFMTDSSGNAIITHEPMIVESSSLTMTHYVDCSLFVGTPNTSYTCTITGKKLNTTESVVSYIDNTGISSDDLKLTMNFEGNNLIADINIAKECAKWYLSQLKKRKDLEFTWWSVATVEAPDYIKLETSDGTIAEMQISEIKYNLYTLTADIKGVM